MDKKVNRAAKAARAEANRARHALSTVQNDPRDVTTITVVLPRSTVAALAALDSDGQPDRALRMLAFAAADGMSRPRSWERDWIRQLFGPFETDGGAP